MKAPSHVVVVVVVIVVIIVVIVVVTSASANLVDCNTCVVGSQIYSKVN